MIWHHTPVHSMVYSQKMSYANRTIWHARHMIAWSSRNKSLLIYVGGKSYYKTLLTDHRWLLRYGLRLKRELYLATLPAHYQGWLCIHRQEGAWNSDTGNGFYGGLQMTWKWMKLVVNAALLSPLDQMKAAETGYRNSGYSHAWLAGQWPNTYPPCSGYF